MNRKIISSYDRFDERTFTSQKESYYVAANKYSSGFQGAGLHQVIKGVNDSSFGAGKN